MHFLLIGICLLGKVLPENIIKNKETGNCRRFLNTKTALVCSHRPEQTQPALAGEMLKCGNDTIKEVVAVYAGLKNVSSGRCTDNSLTITGYIGRCCQLEKNDFLIDIENIRNQLNDNYVEIFTSNCKDKKECSPEVAVLHVPGYLPWRKYSSFLVLEYRCSTDIEIEESNHDSRLERKRALICSHRVQANKPTRDDRFGCQGGLHINVTNIYIGISNQVTCTNHHKSISGASEACCRYDVKDYIFEANCLRDQQTMINASSLYDELFENAYECNRMDNCTVPRRVLPSQNNATKGTYSSYVIVEYTCIEAGKEEYSSTTINRDSSATTQDMIIETSTSSSQDDVDTSTGVQMTTIAFIVGGITVTLLAVALLTGVILLRKRKRRRRANDHINSERGLGNPSLAPGTRYEDMPLADQGLRDQTVSAGATCHNDDDTYDHAMLGNGSAAMKGKTQDPDDTYDHASGSDAKRLASMKGNASEVDDTYDHAGRGTGSASMKGKASDTDDTYNHAMINSGTASMKGKTSEVDDTYNHAMINSGTASMKGKTYDVDDVYDHALIESMKDETKEFDDTYDHAQVENGQASLKGKTEDIDDTYNQAM